MSFLCVVCCARRSEIAAEGAGHRAGHDRVSIGVRPEASRACPGPERAEGRLPHASEMKKLETVPASRGGGGALVRNGRYSRSKVPGLCRLRGSQDSNVLRRSLCGKPKTRAQRDAMMRRPPPFCLILRFSGTPRTRPFAAGTISAQLHRSDTPASKAPNLWTEGPALRSPRRFFPAPACALNPQGYWLEEDDHRPATTSTGAYELHSGSLPGQGWARVAGGGLWSAVPFKIATDLGQDREPGRITDNWHISRTILTLPAREMGRRKVRLGTGQGPGDRKDPSVFRKRRKS